MISEEFEEYLLDILGNSKYETMYFDYLNERYQIINGKIVERISEGESDIDILEV